MFINAGGAVSNVASEYTQLANWVKLAKIALDEAKNLDYTIDQYNIMFENAKQLPYQVRQQAKADLIQLANIVETGLSVAYSSAQIDEDYRKQHFSFDDYAQIVRGVGGARNHDFFSQHYEEWAQSSHDSIRGALRAAGLQAAQFNREEAAVRIIENQIKTAAGTKQLLQAGSSIASLQVEQLQKLRQLQMAQIQLQSAQAAGAVDRQAEADAELQRALRVPTDLNPARDSQGGLRMTDSIY